MCLTHFSIGLQTDKNTNQHEIVLAFLKSTLRIVILSVKNCDFHMLKSKC